MTSKRYGSFEDWFNTRVKSLRSSFLRRAKKAGFTKEDVPTKSDIEEWLMYQFDIVGLTTCYITGNVLSYDSVEIDHRVPVSRGGTFGLDNLGITSKTFNGIKGAFTDKEITKLLEAIGDDSEFHTEFMNRLSQSNRFYNRKKRRKK